MAYTEDDFLLISGIQHFAFCRRQWALIYLECVWMDNERTVSGELLHKRVHDPFLTEKRGDLIITRDMPVFSRTLGITGHCDVVEFRNDKAGVPLNNREGFWLPCPVEYKRGHSKVNDEDRLQLCAQAMCLEEMLMSPIIGTAYIYYGETNRREQVALDDRLRLNVRNIVNEMHEYFERGYTPRVKPTKACSSCSLNEMCMPKLPASENSVRAYIDSMIKEDSHEETA